MSTLRRWLPRFSLRWLLAGVAVLGVGLAAVTSASGAWALGFAIAYHLILPLSIVFSIYSVGKRRAFWVGVGILSLWSHLAFGKGEYLVGERQQTEIIGLLNEYVAAPLVKLQEAQITALADERVQAQVAAFEERVHKLSPSDISQLQSSTLASLDSSFREAVTWSLLYLLLILASFAFGWLACWSDGRRHTGGVLAMVKGQGEKP